MSGSWLGALGMPDGTGEGASGFGVVVRGGDEFYVERVKLEDAQGGQTRDTTTW